MNQTLLEQYVQVMSTNLLYQRNQDNWEYLLNSYMGGVEYARGQYLTRYLNETDGEYAARINATHLENHCKSVISTYISFLFRQKPHRDFSLNGESFEQEMFLRDADLDGRSLDAFMKEVSCWSSVFGHCWVMVCKPSIGAVTLSDEQVANVRPYLTLITPLTVTDWYWHRKPNGAFELTYFKYIEESNDTFATVREWTKTEIKTYVVNNRSRAVMTETVEPNGLGVIPCVLAYNHRSPVRGIGVSDIADIARAQQTIYNLTSEVEQSIRVNGHPALVKLESTEAAAGAGAIITMQENMDPGLRPYVLGVSTDIGAIHVAINHVTQAIDKMANTGSIRSTEATRMSGVAQEQEFQLLNAKLSEKASNLELTEEQIWQYFYQYQAQQWMGETHYPNSFSIRDTQGDVDKLLKIRSGTANTDILAEIDEQFADILDMEGYDDPESDESDTEMSHPETTVDTRLSHLREMFAEGYEDSEILDLHPEITQADIDAARGA